MSCSRIADTVLSFLSDEEDYLPKHALVEHQFVKAGGEARTFLNWTERPKAITDQINEVFSKLSAKKESTWGSNGQLKYKICSVNELSLLMTMIRLVPGQKEFIVMDIGAGKFQFGEHLAELINREYDLPKDITIHIFNLRAEQYEGAEVEEAGRCKIYRLGNFKIENLHEELQKRGLSHLIGQTDIAVTRMCFCHLVDPVGTIQQTFDLIRPETGVFMGDSFFLAREEDGPSAWAPNSKATDTMAWNTRRMLIDTRAPFVMTNGFAQDFFVLRRVDERPCEIPRRYGSIVHTKPLERDGMVFGSDIFCKFIRPSQSMDEHFVMASNSALVDYYISSKSLYNWLAENKIFDPTIEYRLQPLLEPIKKPDDDIDSQS